MWGAKIEGKCALFEVAVRQFFSLTLTDSLGRRAVSIAPQSPKTPFETHGFKQLRAMDFWLTERIHASDASRTSLVKESYPSETPHL